MKQFSDEELAEIRATKKLERLIHFLIENQIVLEVAYDVLERKDTYGIHMMNLQGISDKYYSIDELAELIQKEKDQDNRPSR